MIEFQNRYRPYRLMMMVGDVVLTLLALVAMEKLRPYLPGETVDPSLVLLKPYLYLVVAFSWHSVFALSGVYQVNLLRDFSKQASSFTAAYLLAVSTLAGLLFFTDRETSRMLVIYLYIVDYLVLILMRLAVSTYLNTPRARLQRVPTLIIGVSSTGVELAKRIEDGHEMVARVVGFVDTQPSTRPDLPAPFVGTIEQLPHLITQYGIGQVFIALPGNQSAETESLTYVLESLPVRVYLVPDTIKLAILNAEIERIGQLVVIGLREPLIQGHRRVIKRIMDLLLASLTLLFTWPLLIIIWIAIKLDSSGPALYLPERVGENGKIFKMIKFRTMIVDAENMQSQVTTVDDEGRPIYKVKDDVRITKVGRWLRRTSLDELPQLFNVIKGQMSLVGPRPEQPFITQGYDHWQWQRHLVPPGVTGWWQVAGRSDLPMNLNTQYDIYYVKNYSLLLDLRILIKTVETVLRGRGAY